MGGIDPDTGEESLDTLWRPRLVGQGSSVASRFVGIVRTTEVGDPTMVLWGTPIDTLVGPESTMSISVVAGTIGLLDTWSTLLVGTLDSPVLLPFHTEGYPYGTNTF